MKLCQPVRLGEVAGRVVVDNGEGQSNWERSEESCVHASFTKHPLRGKRAKEHGSGEVRLNARTSEAILLGRLADFGDVADLEIHHCGANKGGDNGY